MKKAEDFTGVTIVYFCHDGNGNFLMNKRSANCRDEHGCWDQGGGGLEFGDTVENTIRKEVQEEYCTDVINFEFLGYRDIHRTHNDKNTHWVALDFKVLVDKEKARNGEPHKFDSVEWFTLDKLPEPLHSQALVQLEVFKENLPRK